MASRRALTTFIVSWSVRTPRHACSSPQLERWGLFSMSCIKFLGWLSEMPYEKYVLTTEELHLLKKDDPQVYEIYWELLCHFHICGQTTGWRNRSVKHMSLASYLFNDINDKYIPVTHLDPSTEEEITKRISTSTSLYTMESNEDTFKPDTIFECFQH